MVRNVLAAIAIFLCTSLGWLVLGMSIAARTADAGTDLGPRVESTWGAPQVQKPPAAFTTHEYERVVETNATSDGKRVVTETVDVPLSLESSSLRVALALEQRQKGLLWFPTYRAGFHGDYVFRNTTDRDEITVRLPFPAPEAIYDDLVLRVDGQPVPLTTAKDAVSATIKRPPGTPFRLETGYRSQGMRTWNYSFGEGVSQVKDFTLEMTTDFSAVDFPQGTISPTEKKVVPGGWLLT